MLAFPNHRLHLACDNPQEDYIDIFCFPNCISAHPGNVLVVFKVFIHFPSLLQFSFGFEHTQKLSVKPRASFALLIPLTFEGDELILCFQENVLEKLLALTSSFILHGFLPTEL